MQVCQIDSEFNSDRKVLNAFPGHPNDTFVRLRLGKLGLNCLNISYKIELSVFVDCAANDCLA